jgi:5,10-methylenetetrahydromethanopterin reductase
MVTAQPEAQLPRLGELGVYLLPGRVTDATRAVADGRDAEALGIGTLWISERYEHKDTSVLLGALGATTGRVELATGVVHPHTRHPLVLAGFGSTLQALSGGRATLGLGRGLPEKWRDMGLASPTLRSLADTADILRDLWRGATVRYDGPAGRFPSIRVSRPLDGPPPCLVLAAMGPKALDTAGRSFDGALTHMMTPDTVAHAGALMRAGAERAGKDPASVRLVHVLPVAPDATPERSATIIGGRLVTYLLSDGRKELIARLNGWNASDVNEILAHPMLSSRAAGPGTFFERGDQALPLDQLAEVGELIPMTWRRGLTAEGTAQQCAARVKDYLDAGADQVLLHASAPAEVAGLVSAYRRLTAPA